MELKDSQSVADRKRSLSKMEGMIFSMEEVVSKLKKRSLKGDR